MNQNESRELVAQPDRYLARQGQSLDERIEGVRLQPGAAEAIGKQAIRRIIRDRVLGLFKVGEIIKEFLDWNEKVDDEIREAKKNALLAEYFNQAEDNADSISALKVFLTNPQGNTLFNKILRILDDSPPDEDLICQLSSTLKHIIDTDFASLFEEHKYALTQIERISAPALAILADHRAWPQINLQSYQTSGPRVTSDYLSEFHAAYVNHKGIFDPGMRSRVRHSLDELINIRAVEVFLVGTGGIQGGTVSGSGGVATPALGELGQLVAKYLKRT